HWRSPKACETIKRSQYSISILLLFFRMLIGDESVIATYAVAQALNAQQITRQINHAKLNFLRVESLG
ncbi:MAG: hypothetical protein DI539_29820, partial [Flavobacterium psychrophilum]